MPLYIGFLNACVFILLLLIHLSCNHKNGKVLHKSRADSVLQQENLIRDTKIEFEYKSIPSGTCSNYKIISALDSLYVKNNLKLKDNNNYFTLDKNLQRVCAFNILGSIETAAPLDATAQLGLELGASKTFDEVRVGAKLPSIIDIKLSTEQKNIFVPTGEQIKPFHIMVRRKINESYQSLTSSGQSPNSVLSLVVTPNGGKPIPLNIVRGTHKELFSFIMPSDLSFGTYPLSLSVKDAAPNVKYDFTVQLVEKGTHSNSPKINSIFIDHNNVNSIPIGTCIPYRVIAKDLAEKEHFITNPELLETKLQPLQSNFSVLPEEEKICAYKIISRTEKIYPTKDDPVDLSINYEGKTSIASFKAAKPPEYKLFESKPIFLLDLGSSGNHLISVKSGQKTENFKINLTKTLSSTEQTTHFATDINGYEILDHDSKEIIKLNSIVNSEDDSVLFNFIAPLKLQKSSLDPSFFTLRMVKFPNITAQFKLHIISDIKSVQLSCKNISNFPFSSFKLNDECNLNVNITLNSNENLDLSTNDGMRRYRVEYKIGDNVLQSENNNYLLKLSDEELNQIKDNASALAKSFYIEVYVYDRASNNKIITKKQEVKFWLPQIDIKNLDAH
ncbi:MAG: hypothetical protein DCC88_11815 [Spirobacillus cienkowskii]|jgi:hypothetical protein|uniref:Uncharacterized protein n=1 Tax=Spirobacillus cienkowskii TaxID=495820 RepID=A0A369KKF3_9BACT|nr:MAG: hypothetical protein DCC88_11815 [Spirobacillus cienkowskii]